MAVDCRRTTRLKPAWPAAAAAAWLWLVLGAPAPALAQAPQAVPDTRDMIEALKPGRQRNLIVRQTAPEPVVGLPASAAAPATGGAPGPATATATPAPASPPATLAAVASPPVVPPASPLPSAPPRPAPEAAGPPPSLSLAIQFELNSSQVRPESGPVLGNLVAAMLSPDLKRHRFLIEGHTDARGVPAANQRLSQARAEEVRLYLVALGVHPARLKAVGKGSAEPAQGRDPLSADNRRVRVVTIE